MFARKINSLNGRNKKAVCLRHQAFSNKQRNQLMKRVLTDLLILMGFPPNFPASFPAFSEHGKCRAEEFVFDLFYATNSIGFAFLVHMNRPLKAILSSNRTQSCTSTIFEETSSFISWTPPKLELANSERVFLMDAGAEAEAATNRSFARTGKR